VAVLVVVAAAAAVAAVALPVAAAAAVTAVATAAVPVLLVLAGEVFRVELGPVEAGRRAGGLVLVEEAYCLGAQARAANLVQHVVEGVGSLGAGQGDFCVLGLRERQPQVLAQVLHKEARLEVALE
jgi:uncharacterized protein (DUF697 family)